MNRLTRALLAAVLLLLAVPLAALAHPLGNFTINHYAGLRVASDAIRLDVVLDMAEIPTFQERLALDTDRDGEVSDGEADAARRSRCSTLAGLLDLRVAGLSQALKLEAAGLSFPSGAGGLPTMRLVCELEAPLAGPIAAGTSITFADHSYPERIGWREITTVGDGTTLEAGAPARMTASARLTAYRQDLLAQPLAMASAAFRASPGGVPAGAFVAPDARPLVAPHPPAAQGDGLLAATPGGVGAEISGLLGTRDLTPLAVLLSLVTALLLGAGHAVTPGHGKTIMAAYLVGTRGSARHALLLGLSVTVSHTLGILALAALIVAAGRTLPPELFQRAAAITSAVIVLAIGAWLVATQVRLRLAGRAPATKVAAAGPNGRAHDHPHPHLHSYPHDPPPHDHGRGPEHAHGPFRHSHVAPGAGELTWRSLFALGLAGGIIPSTNALLILLATVAGGRTEFGLILVIAFGLGMAAVLTGVGLALVYARGWIERLPTAGRGRGFIGYALPYAPLGAGVVVLVLGAYLTGQAVAGSPVF